jgi:ATP-dependent exoDNAse (exonuclease V) beta subunit
MQNSYTVINASAGSGKTYALVQRLLMICLRYPNQQQSIRNILALTFTNKAANEMKERILTWLGNFSADNFAENGDLKNIQKAFEQEGLKITIDELHHRAKKLLDYVLHNYSTLNIGTIDRFNSRLVRSFSYELGLAKNFNLEIEAEPFLIEAVDKMLDQIGENEVISNSFMDYVDYSLENNERINLNKSLYVFADVYNFSKIAYIIKFSHQNIITFQHSFFVIYLFGSLIYFCGKFNAFIGIIYIQ